MPNEILGPIVDWVGLVFAIVVLGFMIWSAKRMKEARKRAMKHNARIEELQAESNQLLRDILAQLRSRD